MRHPALASLFLVLLCGAACVARALPAPQPDRATSALPDLVSCLDPEAVRVDGWLGARIDANIRQRLAVVDTAPLLAGYQRRPGTHSWIGEHVGKWLHAATLAWRYTGDETLRRKLDDVVAQLISTQEADGYLGTYTPDKRFSLQRYAEWDVWSHKYNLIGLLTYYRYTGDPASLAASRRAADLLLSLFPAQKSIVDAGTHRGMAATSVLEPMMLLYRTTGETRYLDFARYVVRSYRDPRGPDIVRALLAGRGVAHTANAKAYELLSNLVGLCEFARYTGDRETLAAVTAAWRDIVEYQRYLTGGMSVFEHFVADHALPNGNDYDIGETCVSVTWLQLNLQLLRLTGEAAYADEIERLLYNHLPAAQHPARGDWCYYTALEGTKRYDAGITCCHSSGPRGFALAPTFAFLQSADTIYLNTPETAHARLELAGTTIELHQDSEFPRAGRARLTLHLQRPVRFALAIRTPAWASPVRCGDVSASTGWLRLPVREWHDGDTVDYTFTLGGRATPGTHGNHARTAFTWGPFVLALDQRQNPALRSLASAFGSPATPPALDAVSTALQFTIQGCGPWDETLQPLTLIPFADAGMEGSAYRVWLRTHDAR